MSNVNAAVNATLVRIEATDPQGPQAMSLLREAAIEARSLYPELIAPDAPMPTNLPLQERGAYANDPTSVCYEKRVAPIDLRQPLERPCERSRPRV